MELKKVSRQANQFWSVFHQRKLIFVICIQILITLGVGATLILTGVLGFDSIIFWIITTALLLTGLLSNIILFESSVRPIRDLMAAILHISGEITNLTPPNPNDNRYANSGFDDALQTLYKLSSTESISTDSPEKTIDEQKPDIEKAIEDSKCGFVALDHNRKIIFANRATPISIDTNGVKSLNLIFNGQDTLENWLDDCDADEVQAEHIWTRIPDRLPNEENRRFFDVIATYQKGITTETVLNLIDRTSAYAADEESLDFIAFAAHELRGPITVIRGYLDVLEDELSDVMQGDQPELFHRLVVSANRLSSYINNILNTSSYDRRHLKMHLTEGTINEVYDMICDDMSLRASAQRRLLTVNIPKDLPTVAVDRASLSEVFSNLIDNAIKYSKEGGIINVLGKVNGGFVEVSVQDNGIGMPGSVVGNLFHKFYRSHRSRETVSGTGIGLYISKAIVESHGGTISVRSEEGKGSIFTVSLPIYSTVADKLKAMDNSNEGLISEGRGWIKNHSMFRG
jgi:signal transduction histidine kinase